MEKGKIISAFRKNIFPFFLWLCHREWLINKKFIFLCFYEKNARKTNIL